MDDLKNKPDAEALDDETLEAVSGGKSVVISNLHDAPLSDSLDEASKKKFV